jgi:hypothetical protein
MLAQDELRNSKFAEFETDAPDNIWHPEVKQEQLELRKKQLQDAIVASAPPQSEPLYAPIHYPEIPAMMSSLQSIPEYQPPHSIVDNAQYQQQDFPFHSQLQQAVGDPTGQDDILFRQQFPSMDQAQPQEFRVNDHPSSLVEVPAFSFPAAGKKMIPQQLELPAAGKKMIPQQLELPAAGTKTLAGRQVDQDSKSRVLASQQPA